MPAAFKYRPASVGSSIDGWDCELASDEDEPYVDEEQLFFPKRAPAIDKEDIAVLLQARLFIIFPCCGNFLMYSLRLSPLKIQWYAGSGGRHAAGAYGCLTASNCSLRMAWVLLFVLKRCGSAAPS